LIGIVLISIATSCINCDFRETTASLGRSLVRNSVELVRTIYKASFVLVLP